MSRSVVVTTILSPSAQVIDHCRRGLSDGTEVIVVGDRKTPIEEYHALAATYQNLHVLSIERQHELFPQLAAALPFNHYARKNVGYAFAIKRGHDAIFDTDDDNLSTSDWQVTPPGTEQLRVQVRDRAAAPAFFNVYSLFTRANLWPRGFPLDHVRATEPSCDVIAAESVAGVAVWQGLVDGDPDVDAIARLTSPDAGQEFRFDPALRRVALDRDVVCPLNSQNTWWVDRSAFGLMYIPATTTFRVCDILRGYVAQHALWARSLEVGFVQPTAYQVRNPHNLLDDFASELPLYLHASRINAVMRVAGRKFTGVDEDVRLAYQALAQEGLVGVGEAQILDAWLASIA